MNPIISIILIFTLTTTASAAINADSSQKSSLKALTSSNVLLASNDGFNTDGLPKKRSRSNSRQLNFFQTAQTDDAAREQRGNFFRDKITKETEDQHEKQNLNVFGAQNTNQQKVDHSFTKYLQQMQRKPFDGNQHTREFNVKQGRLVGIVRQMHINSGLKNVDQFLGIPYAESPVGSRRFMPPGSPLSWKGVKIADTLAPVCPQMFPDLTKPNLLAKGRYDQILRLLPYLKNESEDCLHLNLYVPSAMDTPRPYSKYPVLVFIHGESFEWNSGNPYDGSILASYSQVIVVTLNYRLGILGFLKPGLSEHTIGNFGLLDQIAALQWIKENIAAFGGDSKSVTLIGHGTGAVCVNFLMVSPVAKGLFHRSILMSGSALSDWALNNNPLQVTMQIAEGLNCPLNDDDEEMVSCLRNKRYQEIFGVRISTPQFTTRFGPVVDGLVVPNEPHEAMGQHSEIFSRYDLLFGMTELESYHILNSIGITYGLLKNERDNLLRFFLQNRFEFSEAALVTAIKEYTDKYKDQSLSEADEHRDILLEILSDARVAAPLVQTGLYMSKVNPKSYMYVFAYNSEAGEYGNLAQSVIGEELPYVFGAPLGQAGPFQVYYNVKERLFSEAVMKYFTNFAKTGNPKIPWRESFLHMNPSDWSGYDIDWPEFSPINQSYMHLGITPVVGQRYRHKHMKFWNQEMAETMEKITYAQPNVPFGDLYTPATPRKMFPPLPIGHINMSPIKVEIEPQVNDPIKELRFRLQKPGVNRQGLDDMLNAPPQSYPFTTEIINVEQMTEEGNIFRSELSTILWMIIIIAFLLINVIGIATYIYKKNLKKGDNVNIFDAVGDDKRSKFNDTDDSYILDIMRKTSHNTYEAVKNHSPIDGFKLSRQTSSSTVDAHTKVTDWISNEIAKYSPKVGQKSSLTPVIVQPPHSSTPSSFSRMVSVAVDATPQARSNSILRQEPIEITKANKSFDYPTGKIICQDVPASSLMFDESLEYPDHSECNDECGQSCSSCSCSNCDSESIVNHQHSYSDPVNHVQMYRPMACCLEDVTSFIEPYDVNVTCREEDGLKHPLSPEESLKAIQKMNYPKVLPNFPGNLQFNNSIKRRSLPPQYYMIHHTNSLCREKVPPAPPPRMSSTLGRPRNKNMKDSSLFMTSPIKFAEEPKVEEPKITSNTLHFGPIVPKPENIYVTMKKKQQSKEGSPSFSTDGNQEVPPPESSIESKSSPAVDQSNGPNNESIYAEVVKNSRVQNPQDGIYSISTKALSFERQDSSSPSSSGSSSSTGTIRKIK